MPRFVATLLLLLLCGGCGMEQLASVDLPAGCNPLAADRDCLLPYPSDFFLHDDPSTGSGKRVVIGEAAALRDGAGQLVDLLAHHPADGFSVGTQILALLPAGADDAQLVGATDDLTASLAPDSPTTLLDVERGAPVLHLAELDPRATNDARRALIIRPLIGLRHGARYVVAVHGLRDSDGRILPAPEGFRRLRDGRKLGDAALASLAERYAEEVFAPLAAAGVARDTLQLAWDFTTRSELDAIADMLVVRAATIDYFATHPPELTVLGYEDDPSEHVARRVELTVTVPLFLDDTEPMAQLHRDESGAVAASGTVQVPFTVWVPRSVASRPPGTPPARLVQFGHGFFGGREEVDGFPSDLADERSLVLVAADWWGMSASDRIPLAEAMSTDLGNTLRFTDRLHQAFANFIAVGYAATGPLGSLPELAMGDEPLFDPSALYFYGISQGHILGGSYLALSPLVARGVLSVGGADFSLMMFRARPFVVFLAILGFRMPDALDQQKFAMLSQSTFDRIDPLSYAPYVLDAPLPDGPGERRVLLQIGIGDSAVPNLASELHARALGVSLLEPAARPVAGLPTASAPCDGSALVEYDFGIDPLPGERALPPSTDNEVHEGVRRLAAAKEQLSRFLRPGGLVEHTCEGICDPE